MMRRIILVVALLFFAASFQVVDMNVTDSRISLGAAYAFDDFDFPGLDRIDMDREEEKKDRAREEKEAQKEREALEEKKKKEAESKEKSSGY
mgnify:CR=1 FL=1